MNTESPWRGTPILGRRVWLACLTGLLLPALVIGTGCGQRMPPISSVETMRLLTALRTACSAEKPERLEEVRQRVEEAWADARLTEAEYTKLVEIMDTAAGGDWRSAEQACFQFQKASSG